MKYRYIVIEGSIGSGKSDLSKKLARYYGARLLNEDTAKNPFLIPFYLNPTLHALSSQLHFLIERAALLKEIKEEEINKDALIISNTLIEKDNIFAPIVLQNEELSLYWKLRSKILPEIIRPDLLILLQSSNEIANQRIETQRAAFKLGFPEGYLNNVHNEYKRFFHLYDSTPILIANTDELDFIKNEDHFELLLKTINNMRGKKLYLNLSE